MSQSKKANFFAVKYENGRKWNIWMFAPKIDLIVTIWSDRLGPKFGLNPKGCYRQSPHLKKVWHPSTFFLPMHCFTSSLGSLSFWKCIRKIRLWAKKSWGQQQSIVAKMVSILLSMNFKSGHKLQRKKEKAAGAGTPKHLFWGDTRQHYFCFY